MGCLYLGYPRFGSLTNPNMKQIHEMLYFLCTPEVAQVWVVQHASARGESGVPCNDVPLRITHAPFGWLKRHILNQC